MRQMGSPGWAKDIRGFERKESEGGRKRQEEGSPELRAQLAEDTRLVFMETFNRH